MSLVNPLDFGEYKIVWQGGLMRCCLKTLVDEEFDKEPEIGQTLGCLWCDEEMIYKEDGWHWSRKDVEEK